MYSIVRGGEWTNVGYLALPGACCQVRTLTRQEYFRKVVEEFSVYLYQSVYESFKLVYAANFTKVARGLCAHAQVTPAGCVRSVDESFKPADASYLY